MILLEKLGELELIELIALAILATCYFPDVLELTIAITTYLEKANRIFTILLFLTVAD